MTDDTAARMRALESEERLLRERVKWHTAVDFPTMSVRTDVLLALLDALDEARRERERMIADGWRRCAVGQRTTQFCGMAEQARADEREACFALALTHAAAAKRTDDAASSLRLLVTKLRARGEAKGGGR